MLMHLSCFTDHDTSMSCSPTTRIARASQTTTLTRHSYNAIIAPAVAAASSTSGGSSGSPVLDSQGHAIAMNAGGKRQAASSFYIPLDRVVRALKLLQEGVAVPRGDLQVVWSHEAFDECRRLGLSRDAEARLRSCFPTETGALVVEQVIAGGPADPGRPSRAGKGTTKGGAIAGGSGEKGRGRGVSDVTIATTTTGAGGDHARGLSAVSMMSGIVDHHHQQQHVDNAADAMVYHGGGGTGGLGDGAAGSNQTAPRPPGIAVGGGSEQENAPRLTSGEGSIARGVPAAVPPAGGALLPATAGGVGSTGGGVHHHHQHAPAHPYRHHQQQLPLSSPTRLGTGLEPGDVLLSVNGQPCSHFIPLEECLDNTQTVAAAYMRVACALGLEDEVQVVWWEHEGRASAADAAVGEGVDVTAEADALAAPLPAPIDTTTTSGAASTAAAGGDVSGGGGGIEFLSPTMAGITLPLQHMAISGTLPQHGHAHMPQSAILSTGTGAGVRGASASSSRPFQFSPSVAGIPHASIHRSATGPESTGQAHPSTPMAVSADARGARAGVAAPVHAGLVDVTAGPGPLLLGPAASSSAGAVAPPGDVQLPMPMNQQPVLQTPVLPAQAMLPGGTMASAPALDLGAAASPPPQPVPSPTQPAATSLPASLLPLTQAHAGGQQPSVPVAHGGAPLQPTDSVTATDIDSEEDDERIDDSLVASEGEPLLHGHHLHHHHHPAGHKRPRHGRGHSGGVPSSQTAAAAVFGVGRMGAMLQASPTEALPTPPAIDETRAHAHLFHAPAAHPTSSSSSSSSRSQSQSQRQRASASAAAAPSSQAFLPMAVLADIHGLGHDIHGYIHSQHASDGDAGAVNNPFAVTESSSQPVAGPDISGLHSDARAMLNALAACFAPTQSSPPAPSPSSGMTFGASSAAAPASQWKPKHEHVAPHHLAAVCVSEHAATHKRAQAAVATDQHQQGLENMGHVSGTDTSVGGMAQRRHSIGNRVAPPTAIDTLSGVQPSAAPPAGPDASLVTSPAHAHTRTLPIPCFPPLAAAVLACHDAIREYLKVAVAAGGPPSASGTEADDGSAEAAAAAAGVEEGADSSASPASSARDRLVSALASVQLQACVQLDIQRGGNRLTRAVSVCDLHSLIPSTFLEVSGAVIHPLSVMGARNNSLPVAGCFVSQVGYMLSRADVPGESHRGICYSCCCARLI